MKYAHPTRGGKQAGRQFGLNRALLPRPIEYLTSRLIPAKGTGVWRDIVCPFHDDHTASLRFNIEKGCFRCMACEAKGGDIIAFHMQLKGLSFIDACKDLGAWEKLT